jgi:hypothetical protein
MDIAELPEDALIMDGFDDCIIGTCDRFGLSETVVAYDYDKVIKKLMEEGMTDDEAVEFFEFNMLGAWVGDKTPVFIKIISVR